MIPNLNATDAGEMGPAWADTFKAAAPNPIAASARKSFRTPPPVLGGQAVDSAVPIGVSQDQLMTPLVNRPIQSKGAPPRMSGSPVTSRPR